MQLIFHKSEKYIEEDIFYYISDQRDKHSMIKPNRENLISMTVESDNLNFPNKKDITNIFYPFKKNSIDKIYIGLSFPLFSNNWAASYLRYLLKVIKRDGSIILPVYPEEQASEKGMWSRSFLENIFTSRTGWTGTNNVWAENDGVMSMRIGKKFPEKMNSTLNFFLDEKIGYNNFNLIKNVWSTSKFSSIVEKIIQDKYGNNKVIYCDIGENPSLAFEISVSNYIKIKRTIMVTENTDLYSDLANYFSYRKIAKHEKHSLSNIKKIAAMSPDIISIIYNENNNKLLSEAIEICPKASIIFYGKLEKNDKLFKNYDICNYSSIVATKLEPEKTINHYSDIIEKEINSEDKSNTDKIYVLTPK